MAFDSFGSGGGKAWQTPAPAEKPESAAAAGHSLAPTMRVGGGLARMASVVVLVLVEAPILAVSARCARREQKER